MKKVVIELEDDFYDTINKTEINISGMRTRKTILGNLLLAVKTGKEIPDNCGRLIDADKLSKKLQEHHDFYINAYGGFSNMPKNDKSRVDEITHCISEIVNSDTVL